MSLTVLSVAATGVLIPFSNAANIHAEGTRRTLTSKLASELLEEICATDYDNIIGRWHGYSEAEGHIRLAGYLVEFAGDEYKYFSRSATCVVARIGSGSNRTTLGIWVTVVVNYHGREITRMSTLVSE